MDLQRMLDDFDAQGVGAGRAVPVSPQPSTIVKPLSALGKMQSASTANAIATLETALAFISPDALRGMGTIFGSDGAPVTDYWFGCLLAARREYGDAAKEVMRRWSQQSMRYGDGSGFEHAWKQHDPQHSNPIGIGSLFKLAQSNGWRGSGSRPAAAEKTEPDRLRFRLLDRAAIMAIPPIEWRVKGLLPASGIAAIFGPSGSGKSFLAMDLAASIALGQDWFGHRTTQCAVTYVMLEAEAGLRNRIEAWEMHNGSPLPAGFRALVQPVSLADEQDVEDLAAILPKCGVSIIDTLNRAAPGMDENSSQDMGRILAAMKRIQEVAGGLVLVVHHTGKDASKGMRGHSSLHAALDGAIQTERTANSRHWIAAKVKDGEDGKVVAFQLHRMVLGADADGDEISSCAVGPDKSTIFRAPEPSGKNQKVALSTIRRLLSASLSLGQAGSDPHTKCLKVEAAVVGVAATLTTTLPNKRNNEARRLVGALTKGGYLQSAIDTGGDAWLWQ